MSSVTDFLNLDYQTAVGEGITMKAVYYLHYNDYNYFELKKANFCFTENCFIAIRKFRLKSLPQRIEVVRILSARSW